MWGEQQTFHPAHFVFYLVKSDNALKSVRVIPVCSRHIPEFCPILPVGAFPSNGTNIDEYLREITKVVWRTSHDRPIIRNAMDDTQGMCSNRQSFVPR